MLTENLPSVEDIRTRIDSVEMIKYRNALRYEYLICGRVSEVCGKYGPKGTDAQIVEIDGEEAVLFPVKTAKRKGKLRPVVLPLKYEPWARALVGWFEHRGEEDAFPFCMRSLQRVAHFLFEGLSYPIEAYGDTEPHWNPVCTHALRHIRALQDLLCFYGFDGLDLAIYGGWSSQSVEARLPGIATRYLHLIGNNVNQKLLVSLASKYFSKLCKFRD